MDNIQISGASGESAPLVGARCTLCGGSTVTPFLNAPDRFEAREKPYRLVRCAACTCVWQDQPPPPSEMGAHYTDDYHRAIAKAGETNSEDRWGWARDGIQKYKQGGNLLDIGCSSGAFLRIMKTNREWNLFGVEMESSTAQKAEIATGASVYVGDVLTAPFAPDSFDVITSFDLLEHVYEPREFLEKVREWLKPGGIYFVSLPNIDSWESHIYGSYWYGLELPRHITHFSPTSLRYVMSSLNFKELSLTTSDVTYAERSTVYVRDKFMTALGFSPRPMSTVSSYTFFSKVCRKAARITIFNPMGKIASMAGSGAAIIGVFQK